MRILVTGSRDWEDDLTLEMALWKTVPTENMRETVIVHGGAPGADTIAHKWAEYNNFPVEPHPAEWKKYGKAAGPKRNQEMVDAGADVCLAFLKPGSKGTADCIKRANKAGIPVKIYPAPGTEKEANILAMPPAKRKVNNG